jgi:hypothetical protein
MIVLTSYFRLSYLGYGPRPQVIASSCITLRYYNTERLPDAEAAIGLDPLRKTPKNFGRFFKN